MFSFELEVEYSTQEVVRSEEKLGQMIGDVQLKKSVLIVDDDLVNRKVMYAVVKKLGHSVILAEDGSIAVDYCKRENFDIILMDISMPNMDGFEATKQIRRLDGYQRGGTPIVALTAYALDGDREKCLSNGFDDYMSKPIEISEVANKISEWVMA